MAIQKNPPDPFERMKSIGSWSLGVALVGCAVVDAAFNPFAGLTADKFLFAGLALMGFDGIKTGLGK